MQRIGILYPGEMGAALAGRLVQAGFEVLSCVTGRSKETRSNAERSQITLKVSMEEVIAESEVVFCLVPCNHAINIAHLFSGAVRRTVNRPLYVDCNSVQPNTMREIGSLVSDAGADILDGVFIGSAAMIDTKTSMYLSGLQADELALALENALNVVAIGKQIGEASGFKMCFSAFNKGLVALFLEIAAAAGKAGKKELLIKCLDRFYPGTMETVRRLLPSYPVHVARRVEEMNELVSFLRDLGQVPSIPVGVKSVLESFGDLFVEEINHKPQHELWTMEDILEICQMNGLLSSHEGEKGGIYYSSISTNKCR